MKRLALLLFNTVTFAITLYLNYIFGSGAGSRRNVGEISAQYDTLITPAGYAFSIWGLIYLLLLSFIVFQWISFFKNQNHKSLVPSSIWFGLSNVFNGLWIVVWTSEMITVSVLVIFALLICLLTLVVKLRLETWDAPLDIIAFVWWPICVYTGWIITASVVNLSVWFLAKEILLSNQVFWTIAVLFIGTGIYLALIRYRNMREASLVGVWAFVAIAVKQWDNQYLVAYAALIFAALLFLAAGIHGFKNRKTSPFQKIIQSE
ncbi:hypothetical protein SAMN00777080_2257 [Aquiflexum balticum DSM 16537]|uniref:TspO and MBR related proteins n=1 Tax=Aquiflexum balticum DSM 16537 TaxID=758820 RepID=A0A1W2H4V7_9BACT|nr:hypothetical protein [Aquiflexum balticum]SMD43652.1 hypothetical protein SAMN00777080_2257 [Aquiflexum balticum DSM 16537]